MQLELTNGGCERKIKEVWAMNKVSKLLGKYHAIAPRATAKHEAGNTLRTFEQ